MKTLHVHQPVWTMHPLNWPWLLFIPNIVTLSWSIRPHASCKREKLLRNSASGPTFKGISPRDSQISSSMNVPCKLSQETRETARVVAEPHCPLLLNLLLPRRDAWRRSWTPGPWDISEKNVIWKSPVVFLGRHSCPPRKRISLLMILKIQVREGNGMWQWVMTRCGRLHCAADTTVVGAHWWAATVAKAVSRNYTPRTPSMVHTGWDWHWGRGLFLPQRPTGATVGL